MCAQEVQKKTKLSKKARKKKGLIYLLVGGICFGIYFIMWASNIRGLIPSLISLVFIIFFILGLVYLIGGLVGKD